ncbi:olfactory receptor 51G2-like [Chelonia mydas]|uniref:olfactory receptor 51G2-like n=1 Tax=Chelonia mydas TaxID=8469 RepID=UPI0018A1E7DA|nr:olfactory receptor 51G2-like [Chelonia mydas]
MIDVEEMIEEELFDPSQGSPVKLMSIRRRHLSCFLLLTWSAENSKEDICPLLSKMWKSGEWRNVRGRVKTSRVSGSLLAEIRKESSTLLRPAQYITSALNDTNFNSAVFLLTGIPGQEDVYLWISIPFCLMYVISIVGNSVILLIIKTDPSLHEPMYIFLSMLAVTDLGLLIATIPTILGTFLFNSMEISLHACFAQLFFIHLLQCIESSMLLLMAFDRFVAICNPLRYASILTLPRIAKMGLVFMLRGVAIVVPLPLLLKQYQYCRVNVLSHSYCLHQEVMKMACSDITVNSICGLSGSLLSMGLDSLLIFFSYVMIFKTVSIASKVEFLRPLKTCVSHLCVVLLFYIPETSLSAHKSELLSCLCFRYVYLLVPPLMNRIVYSVKSKHLRGRIIRLFIK